MPSNDCPEGAPIDSINLPVPQSRPTLPDAAAPPDEVRRFVLHILHERRLPQSDVEDVAARWRIGSGHEMRSYDPSMYLEIFGSEYGWILYREIKLRVHEEKCQKLTYKYGTELIAAALFAVAVGAAYVCCCDVGGLTFAIAYLVAFTGFIGLFIWVVVAMLTISTPAEDIENELRRCRKTCGAKEE